MKKLSPQLFTCCLFIITFVPAILAHGQDAVELNGNSITQFVINPADFNPDDKEASVLRYEPFGNKKEAIYEKAEKKDGTPVIKATSESAISTVTTSIKADPNEFRFLEWEWKIDSVLETGDLTKKDGDDFAARIYVTFDYPVSKLPFGQKIKYRFYKTFTSFKIPLRSLNYVWANKEEVGTIAESPFTGWVQYIVVESGNENAGEWVSLKRNILEDYRKAFGEEPPAISGITIMTDSDNTGESTEAWFGKIILSKN
ncbi:MAG TPA: DUF3047 domain-containing protein [Halalkalibaculum sp.]|nr:DUF3047 domain-containing protein [Halalkalibaculum sp.]